MQIESLHWAFAIQQNLLLKMASSKVGQNLRFKL